MARYIYSTVFDPGDFGGYTVTFPDPPGCVTEGDSQITPARHVHSLTPSRLTLSKNGVLP